MYFQVDIKVANPDKTELTRVMRTLSPHLKLNQATDIATYICNHGKVTLAAGIDVKVANHIKKQMSIEGVHITVNESSIETPMIIFPSVNEKWKWGKLLTIEKAF